MNSISAFNPMWAQFEIGVLSAFVVIPVYLLFSIMFRFIKVGILYVMYTWYITSVKLGVRKNTFLFML